MNAGEILASALSPDAQIRANAERQLENAARDHWPAYMSMLSQELANEKSQSHIRNSAGIALKNALTAKEAARQARYAQQWLELDENTKVQIKQTAMMTLASMDQKAGQSAAQFIAAIAAIEIPQNQWPNLLDQLLANITGGQSSAIKQSSLQAIGYICETVDPAKLVSQSNQILTAVVQGVRKEEPDPNVRFAAINALFDSLEFVRENFEREGERNFLMQVVCEATQSTDARIQTAAFGCLVRIMQLYYDKMKLYMEKALYGLTISGMKSDNPEVALQAVEFWSTVCEEEIEVMMENTEALEVGEESARQSFDFAKLALPEILPMLLELLCKQDQDADEDEWNPSMAAGICIQLFAQCVEGLIVGFVVRFVEQNIRSENWRQREAAVMAFGSILDGPPAPMLEPLVTQALPVLISMMSDQVNQVKDTTAWTLGRITDLVCKAIYPDMTLPGVIQALLTGLNDNPRIVTNCCWAIMNLAEQLGSSKYDDQTSAMSPFYEQSISALMKLSERSGNENNARTSAYEAISTLVTFAAVDSLNLVSGLTVIVLERLQASLNARNQFVSLDERIAHEELQSNIIGVLTSCVRRLGDAIRPHSDQVMTILLQLMQFAAPQSIIHEDVFLAVGALTSALDSNFRIYVDSFIPYLNSALENQAEHQLCSIAIGLIGDICRALGEGVRPYCDNFMQYLYRNLQSTVILKSVKPAILSCFGDIALAIGVQFESYLTLVMQLLQQASTVRATPDDGYEQIDFVANLRKGIVEAYTGIVQALKGGNKGDLLLPYVQHIFGFCAMVYNDPDCTEPLMRDMIGLLGDLASAFPNKVIAQFFRADWISECLRTARVKHAYSPSTKDVARWARDQIRIQVS